MRIKLQQYLALLECPITADLFEHPVSILETGHTIGIVALANWLEQRRDKTCPITRAPLAADYQPPQETVAIVRLIDLLNRLQPLIGADGNVDIDLAELLACLVVEGQSRIPLKPITDARGQLLEGIGAEQPQNIKIAQVTAQIASDIIAFHKANTLTEADKAAINRFGLMPKILFMAIEHSDKSLFDFCMRLNPEGINWNENIVPGKTLLAAIFEYVLSSPSLRKNQDMLLSILRRIGKDLQRVTLLQCARTLLAVNPNPLHFAVVSGDIRLVELVLSLSPGINLSEPDNEGNTPLMLAILVRNYPAASYFLDRHRSKLSVEEIDWAKIEIKKRLLIDIMGAQDIAFLNMLADEISKGAGIFTFLRIDSDNRDAMELLEVIRGKTPPDTNRDMQSILYNQPEEAGITPPVSRSMKCVVVGDRRVGKTALLYTYFMNIFPSEYQPTMFDNIVKCIMIDNQAVDLGLWDMPYSLEVSLELRSLGYPQTDVFIVLFSLVSVASFERVRTKLAPEIYKYCPGASIVLCGTRLELRDDPEVIARLHQHRQAPISYQKGEALAREIGAARYMECSIERLIGVKELFDEAVRSVLYKPHPRSLRQADPGFISSLASRLTAIFRGDAPADIGHSVPRGTSYTSSGSLSFFGPHVDRRRETIVTSNAVGLYSKIIKILLYPIDPAIDIPFLSKIRYCTKYQIWTLTDQKDFVKFHNSCFHFPDLEIPIIIFKASDTNNFVQRIQNINREIDEFFRPTTKKILLCTGVDIRSSAKPFISLLEGSSLAVNIGAYYAECSLQTGEGVEELFELVDHVAAEFPELGIPASPMQGCAAGPPRPN